MARNGNEVVVTQTVLDRLIDNEPANSEEAPGTRAQSVRQLKASLRRDLEWLLNTHRNANEDAMQYAELPKSLYYYGLPEFTSLSFSNPHDRTRLLRALEVAIGIFEPRLAAVRVTALEGNPNSSSRVIRFQIEGMLKMDPAPEQVSFDTVLQLASGEYQVKGEPGA